MLTRGVIICCNICLWNFPFFSTVVEVVFFSPPTLLFLLLCLLQVSSNLMALKIMTGESATCASCGSSTPAPITAAALSSGMRHAGLFQGYATQVIFRDGTLGALCNYQYCDHCCDLHFFPCMVMNFLRCLPFSWRGRKISFGFFLLLVELLRGICEVVFSVHSLKETVLHVAAKLALVQVTQTICGWDFQLKSSHNLLGCRPELLPWETPSLFLVCFCFFFLTVPQKTSCTQAFLQLS